MLIPLVAVPLMAIFGVPQFSPLVASPSHEGDPRDPDVGLGEAARFADGAPPESLLDSGRSARPGSAANNAAPRGLTRAVQPADDPFLEIDHAAAGAPSANDGRQPRSRRELPTHALAGWQVEASEQAAESRNAPRDLDETTRRGQLEPRGERSLSAGAARGTDARGTDARNADALDDAPPFDAQANPGADPFDGADSRQGAAAPSHADDDLLADGGDPTADLGQPTADADPRAGEPRAGGSALSRARRSVEIASERIERRGPITWKGAVHRLNSLGIHQYQLQPGQGEGEFHFSCSYTPEDNPRICHRFEAEANEPLKAVEKVLSQIETWMDENR